MSVDTEIQGSPASIESAETWLRDQLATALSDASDRLNDARRDAESSWDSLAGDQFATAVRTGRDTTDDLETATKKMADDLGDFAEKLRTCQSDMATIRTDARAAGLSVSGFVIADPGPGPARPPDGFTGTEAEVAAHDRAVAAYDAHQDLVRAYNHASSEADRIDRKYATACRELQDEYTVGQHASWIVTMGDVLGDLAAGVIGVSIARNQSALHGRARDLLGEAERAIRDLQANPDRYIKRKWFFFRTLDEARLEADRLAIQGKLDEAEDLLRRADDLDGGRLPRYLGRAGKVLGPLGLGLGVYNDYQEGESATQIAVSQGGSLLAGVGAGAAVGAAVGSVVPVAGTAVGAAVGAVVGAGVSIFADGAIDSLFENGPDVGEAFEEGLDALADTGDAIADGVGGAIDTVGGWFS
ncbi:WXG100-like domain-containing protein [Nocardioides deserti]|uniref:Outer membrane channel protein CpnT-like N-terminal domain-containing protein n=1 Tax=Nocardioides deserti TaxID=1588644 RepID=A0ABR6UEK1_9ACTN|nr:hypothetical protein [Nocardioides deserti]MBC2962394.1 hypothetical protein [Nocardioides deserti]GGO77891.1 hypothetical protein GCM10012276_34050 [Nocardioides deserti]